MTSTPDSPVARRDRRAFTAETTERLNFLAETMTRELRTERHARRRATLTRQVGIIREVLAERDELITTEAEVEALLDEVEARADAEYAADEEQRELDAVPAVDDDPREQPRPVEWSEHARRAHVPAYVWVAEIDRRLDWHPHPDA
jgi:hypothetical protein